MQLKPLPPLLVMADQASMAGESAGNAYRKIFQAALDAKKIKAVNDDLKGTGIKFNFLMVREDLVGWKICMSS